MAIELDERDTPGWWLKKLDLKLHERRKTIQPLYDRYEGNAPVPRSLRDAPDSAKAFFKTARTNLAEMVVKAVRYRMAVTAILTPAANSEFGDRGAWDKWRRSGMNAEQHDVVRHMLLSGSGYVITAKYNGELAATSEDPRQVVTIHDPVRQSMVRASAKFFHDADYGRAYAYLYMPDPDGAGGRRWVAYKDTRSPSLRFNRGWDWDETQGGAEGEALQIAQPVVRYRSEEGVGEFTRHTDILDRIDHLVLQGMAIATFQAFKQRGLKADWAELEEEGDDFDEGEVDIDSMLEADPGAIWKLPLSAEMWESGSVDLTPITSMANKEIERLSAVSFTPLWMFIQEGQNQTASGVSLVREGLTSKVLDRIDRASYSHAQVVANLYAIDGLPDDAPDDLELPTAYDIEIVWRPVERYGLGEKYEAARSAKEAGVPWRTIMREVLQFSPEQVRRMETERMNDMLNQQLLLEAPAPPPTTPTQQAAAAAPTPIPPEAPAT